MTMLSAHRYPSIPDASLLFSPPSSHPGCVPSTHPGNSLAVSGTGWRSHGRRPMGTAADPRHGQSLSQDPSLGTRRGQREQHSQAAVNPGCCSVLPFQKGSWPGLREDRNEEGEARWSVEVCVGREWTPGDRDKQLGGREGAALIGICRALSL